MAKMKVMKLYMAINQAYPHQPRFNKSRDEDTYRDGRKVDRCSQMSTSWSNLDQVWKFPNRMVDGNA